MQVYVLCLDQVLDLGLSAILDTLATSNELAAKLPNGGGETFVVRMVGVRRRVRTQRGLAVPVAPVTKLRRPDVVMIPALGANTPETVANALERADVRDAQEVIVKWAARGSQVCAACGGTFILASTSLLDGGSATTTWWLAPMFRKRFPKVQLDESQMVVTSGACVTAGAALAHLDLALWLVRQRSPELAMLVARFLMIDSRPSASVFAIPDQLAHSDPMVAAFERWARATLSEPFSLQDAAKAAGTSTRTLARRLRQVLGKTPVSYVQELRIERAVHLLRTSDHSVDEIATQVGYSDGVTLRNLLRRAGRGVRELRQTFAGG